MRSIVFEGNTHEQLKHELSGFWSRRISQYDRLVYAFDDDCIHIFAMGGHYNAM